MLVNSIKKYIFILVLVVIFCLGFIFTPFYVRVDKSNLNLIIQNTLPMTQSACNNSNIEDWPTLHGNFNRTGVIETTPKEGNTTIWSFKTGESVISSPAISNGFVYVGSNDNKLYCINAINGESIWNFTTKGAIQSSPTIANGLVYFGSNDNNCYCLNATTGTLLWNYTTGNTIYNSAAISNGRIYISSFDNYFYCLNETNGMLLWKLQIGNDSIGSDEMSCPAITDGRVYIGGLNRLYCLNTANGAIIWDLNISCILSTPVIKDGLLYVGCRNLYCLNATTGTTKWINSNASFLISIPAIVNGYVYAGSLNGMFYCFNAKTGIKLWEYPLGNYIYTLSFELFKRPVGTTSSNLLSSPAVANEMVYIGSRNENVYCLNTTTGKLIWNYTTGASIDSSPAIYNGAVYIGTYDGNIYCLPMIMPYTSESHNSPFLLFGFSFSFGIIFMVVLFSIIAIILTVRRINAKKRMRMA